MKRLLIIALAVPLFGAVEHLSLHDAIKMVKRDNLEIRASKFYAQMKEQEVKAVRGYNFGKLTATVQAMRSNDAGNVFGFKVQSREAAFKDFGFSDFLAPLGGAIYGASMGKAPSDMSGLLNVEPRDLNYPEARNHYVTKFTYMLPLFTGGKLHEYLRVTKSLATMAKYDLHALQQRKIDEVKNAFSDIALVDAFVSKLSTIKSNIERLQSVVREMIKEGYAKDVDLLEVEAKLSEVDGMLEQAKLNKELAYEFLSFLLDTKVKSIKKQSVEPKIPHFTAHELEHNNIDIKKAKLGLEMTKMAMNIERSNFLPEVGAFAEYGSADDRLFNDFKKKDFYTVGIQLKWNIFNGGIDKANYEKAKLHYLMVSNQLRMAKRGIALKANKLRSEALNLASIVKNYQNQLRYANRLYENYKERYKEGMVSISELLIKQSKQIEVMLKLLQAKNEKNKKIYQLRELLNK